MLVNACRSLHLQIYSRISVQPSLPPMPASCFLASIHPCAWPQVSACTVERITDYLSISSDQHLPICRLILSAKIRIANSGPGVQLAKLPGALMPCSGHIGGLVALPATDHSTLGEAIFRQSLTLHVHWVPGIGVACLTTPLSDGQNMPQILVKFSKFHVVRRTREVKVSPDITAERS